MFDIDSGKLLIIGIVALVVIGPKELPGVMRQVGQAIGKLRRMAAEFQGQFMDAMREAELDDLKKDVEKMSKIGDLDPFSDVNKQLSDLQADVESSLAAPVTPVHSADLPSLPNAPAEGEATVAAAGMAPTAEITPQPPPIQEPVPAEPAKTSGAA